MEESRLKPMVADYDVQMFNRLYEKTEALRRKLASQINSHRYGLQYEDILSFFDIKFIYIYNKYCKVHPEPVLLGHLLNGLAFFKCRILRSAYTQQYSQTILSEESIILGNHLIEAHPMEEEKNYYSQCLREFMAKHLSENAYEVFDLLMSPPPYIFDKLNTDIDSNLHKIPDQLILDYFELGNSDKAHKFLNGIKKEIRAAINYAKIHFNKN